MRTTRIILGVVTGLLFFLFLAVDLVLFGVLATNSVVVTILPLVGAIVGGVLASLAAKRSRHLAPTADEPAAA